MTGGCGYIGSHICGKLASSNYQVVVIDNLSTGFLDNLKNNETFYNVDLGDKERVQAIFREEKFDAVMHLAASISVSDSVQDPLAYYRNNTVNTINLIESCTEFNVEKFIFSSTAAVYGDVDQDLVTEDSSLSPASPYGSSKLVDEWIIRDVGLASRMNYVILRYFNVAGADPLGQFGPRSKKESNHLFKVLCEVVSGKRDHLEVFGRDYDTPDGSGIRDYIHVSDLAEAHICALKYLEAGEPSLLANCGYGHGYSVLDILHAFEAVTGSSLPVIDAARRAGDPARVVADSKMARTKLGWQPKFDDINELVRSAIRWEEYLGGKR